MSALPLLRLDPNWQWATSTSKVSDDPEEWRAEFVTANSYSTATFPTHAEASAWAHGAVAGYKAGRTERPSDR